MNGTDMIRDRTAAWDDAIRVPELRAEEILGAGGTATILLRDQRYTLRLTRARKLILTK